MICLSKADERSLRHLSFNQSPPALSASQTTCQDLNGVVNLREHVASDQDHGGVCGVCGTQGQGALDDSLHHTCRSPERLAKPVEAGQWVNGPFPASHKAAGGDGLPLSPAASPSRRMTNAWVWACWILSVAVAYSVLSCFNANSAWAIFSGHSSSSNAADAPAAVLEPTALLDNSTVSPMAITRHKRSACASGGIADKDEYNLPLHVGALFIILFFLLEDFFFFFFFFFF
ncbi:hypothetical protein NQ176_g4071 [Zarea fungicola]|uniref:Uncharacterized protein n=1 Tax=Zarea fungicola TaxID=93591 RepID=A0ACC1NG86_9HYPO|nr:hypothetical protein NQ176_g4071 [Lecanicillium fungicola]